MDQSIAQMYRITQRLHRERVFFKSRKVEEISYRTKTYDQVIVFKLVRVGISNAMSGDDPFVRQPVLFQLPEVVTWGWATGWKTAL